MEIPEIPSNSYRNTAPALPKRAEVKEYNMMPTGTVSVTETLGGKKGKLLSLILPEDVPDIWTYFRKQGLNILKYTVWPNIQDMLVQSFCTIIGVSAPRKSSGSSIPTISRVSYNYNGRYQNGGGNLPRTSIDDRPTIYENLGFETANEAEIFMDLVSDLFDEQNGYITVLQFYNIARRKTFPEQNNYGWLSLNAMKRKYQDGLYYVDMSYPVSLDI